MRFIQSFSFLLLFSVSLLFSQTEGTKEEVPVMVSVAWLQAHYDDPHLVLIDVRDEKEFAKGHLKRAVNMPVFRDLFDKSYMMPKLSFLQELFSNAGIDDKSMIVVYGGKELIWAARFYWISEVLGADNVGLLQVSFGNWKEGELPVTTEIYKPKKTNFVPRVDNSKLATKLSTLLSIGKRDIIDGRPRDFYMGKKSHAKRYGHIPSALNYPGSQNYMQQKEGSHMKSIESLKSLYKTLPKDKSIILYCEDGADAALNFLVLESLGYKVSVYDGSWLEWGNDEKLPYVNPSKGIKGKH